MDHRRPGSLRPAPNDDPDCEPDVVEAAHPAVMEATARSPKTKLPEERDEEEKEPVAELLDEEDLEPRWVPRSH